MFRTTVFPGRYIQGEHALQRLGMEIKRFGNSGFIICTSFVFDNLLEGFRDSLESALPVTIVRFGGECSDSEIDKLTAEVQKVGAEVVVGIGGGKTLDTAKAVGHGCKTPVVTVPTLASTDAP